MFGVVNIIPIFVLRSDSHYGFLPLGALHSQAISRPDIALGSAWEFFDMMKLTTGSLMVLQR